MTQVILTCSSYFSELALNEIRRPHPDTHLLRSIAPGLLLLETPNSFEAFTAPWRDRLPIYLHHLFPVHTSIAFDVQNTRALAQAARRLTQPPTVDQIRGTPDLEPALLAAIQQSLNRHGHPPSTKVPRGSILSILIAPEEQEIRAFLGVSPATDNLSPWAGGQIPITEAVCNRAGYKLIEALDAFAIRLRRGDHALDLGAAPGAWTTLLRARGMRVTSVAPMPLYPWLAFDSGVKHECMLAEQFLERCHTSYDLIVNDMRLYPQDSARLMVEYAQHLRNEGIAIMTLKLGARTPQRAMDHAFRILRKVYRIIRVRQLVSNRHEVTLFLRRRA